MYLGLSVANVYGKPELYRGSERPTLQCVRIGNDASSRAAMVQTAGIMGGQA